MKKLLAILFVSAVIYSCGDNAETKKEETKTVDTVPATPAPDATASTDKGLELIGGSDCMACHSIDNKIIGPAYKDVAAKYENTQANIDSLASKIKHGGSGNWGNAMMTPHPDLADADAKEMVKYILSLKK